jgi:hypothetical protein
VDGGRLNPGKETQKYLDGWGKKHGPMAGRGVLPMKVEKLKH